MRIEQFKRWHWAIIGLLLGLVYSGWRGWVGPDSELNDRTTIDSTELERLVAKKSQSGQPLIKDIRYFGRVDGTDWVIANTLTRSGKAPSESYIPVKIPAERPFRPTVNPPSKPNPNYTVVD